MLKSEVVKKYRTQTGVAAALTKAGYPLAPCSVSHWDDVVPELQARRLAEITRGRLKFDPAVYRGK